MTLSRYVTQSGIHKVKNSTADKNAELCDPYRMHRILIMGFDMTHLQCVSVAMLSHKNDFTFYDYIWYAMHSLQSLYLSCDSTLQIVLQTFYVAGLQHFLLAFLFFVMHFLIWISEGCMAWNQFHWVNKDSSLWQMFKTKRIYFHEHTSQGFVEN
jgi:hypothetical protein